MIEHIDLYQKLVVAATIGVASRENSKLFPWERAAVACDLAECVHKETLRRMKEWESKDQSF